MFRHPLSSGADGRLSPQELTADSVRIGEVGRLLDEKELRWLELDEIETI